MRPAPMPLPQPASSTLTWTLHVTNANLSCLGSSSTCTIFPSYHLYLLKFVK